MTEERDPVRPAPFRDLPVKAVLQSLPDQSVIGLLDAPGFFGILLHEKIVQILRGETAILQNLRKSRRPRDFGGASSADHRFVGKDPDDRIAEILFQRLIILFMGETNKTGHRVEIQKIGGPGCARFPVVLAEMNPPDGPAAEALEKIIRFSVAFDLHDKIFIRRAIGAFPHFQAFGGKLRIAPDDLAVTGTGGVHGFVVKDHVHAELPGFRDGELYVMEPGAAHIPDTLGQPDPRVYDESVHTLFVKFKNLSADFLFGQFIVPEPERHGRKLARRVFKLPDT